ncbi:MAG TPA: hypothetical protein VFH68_00245 [Polyangia bacterium]|nr:hypothetical protein [Polyangia bacterium]
MNDYPGIRRVAPVAIAWLLGIAPAASSPGLAEARSPRRVAGVARPRAAAPASGPAAALSELHAQEERLRAAADFRHPPPGDKTTGPDPFVVRALPGGDRFVGLLRGSAEVVLLDGDLRIVARAPAPRSPTGLALGPAGEIWVSGDLDREIARFRVTAPGSPPRLVAAGRVDLGAGRRIRDLALGPEGLLYAVDAGAGRLITIGGARGGPASGSGEIAARREEIAVGHGPIRVVRAGAWLVVGCLLEHALQIFQVGADGRPSGAPARVQHDGPIWTFDAAIAGVARGARADQPDDLILAAGGVEDHPLDRTIGSFGYIDSFLTVYRVTPSAIGPRVQRLSTTNLSEHGVVTPKVVALEITSDGGAGRAWVTGYGSEGLAALTWPRFTDSPTVQLTPLPPGTTSLARRSDGALVFADPLLDAWIAYLPLAAPAAGAAAGAPVLIPIAEQQETAIAGGAPPRPTQARLGEALFFTTLMAPWNRADGATSRFTCETCHFEGGIDGRTHHTGRGDVRATTKPLRGLLANRPYFSRALDPDLATMVNNEFRVAGANSGHDPWFDLQVADHPWLAALGVAGERVPAPALRAALITFLAGFTPLPNPDAARAATFTPRQRAGAALFRDRCEGCHQARLISDDPSTRIPFGEWEPLILSDANPLVWGMPEYRKTGVVPYVHEQGARVPSLRRISTKYPYFTNGSARSLEELIARARFPERGFAHGGAETGGEALNTQDAGEIAAFLDLL